MTDETTCQVATCDRPSDDWIVCKHCAGLLEQVLGEIPWMLDELDTVITQQTRYTTESSGKSAETPMMFNVKASDMRGKLATELDTVHPQRKAHIMSDHKMTEDEAYCLGHGHNPTDGDRSNCIRCGNPIPPKGRFIPDDPAKERVLDAIEFVIDAIEETFLEHLPPKALSYCAQEDVNAGLDALRERFGVDGR